MNIQRQVHSVAQPAPLEREGITAAIDGVAFAPSLDAPPDRPFAFLYAMTIVNRSSHAITIHARKWVIKEALSGRCHVIEGEGLAGTRPKIGVGGTFHFECYHVVAANSIAEGALLAVDDAGSKVLIRVPAFVMNVTPSV